MDDLCLSIKVFRELSNQNSQDSYEWMENIPEFLEAAEESVINQLCDILLEEMQKGLSHDKFGAALRTTGDAIGTAPLARKDHFIYGILDLIQQHIQPLDSGKVNFKVMEFSLQVVKMSPYSYIRCKGFEVLAALSSKPGIGQAPVQRVYDLLASGTWPIEIRGKVANQWKITRKRAVDVESSVLELRSTSPDIKSLTEIPLKVSTGRPSVNCRVKMVLQYQQLDRWKESSRFSGPLMTIWFVLSVLKKSPFEI